MLNIVNNLIEYASGHDHTFNPSEIIIRGSSIAYRETRDSYLIALMVKLIVQSGKGSVVKHQEGDCNWFYIGITLNNGLKYRTELSMIDYNLIECKDHVDAGSGPVNLTNESLLTLLKSL